MPDVEDAGELPRWSGEAVPADGDAITTPSGDRTPARPGMGHPPQPFDPQRRRRRGLGTGLLIGLLGGLLLAAVAGGAYWLGTRQGEAATTSGSGARATEDELRGEAASPTTEVDDQADPDAEPDSPATTLEVETTLTTGAAGESPALAIGAADGQLLLPDGFVPSDPNYENRIEQATEYAVVRGGKVYLYGFTPTQESLDASVAVTAGVMGPDGYVVERFVDPDAPDVEGSPVFVDDKVLFAFNSTELQPASLPVLDLGVALMLQNPTARMLIIARSDAVGSAAVNLEISQERGEAVVDYWVSQGVERSRMTIDARGEADATESDDAEMAALNRSVEFVVSDVQGDEG